MSYNHKIIDQKYHLKGLISPAVCNQLIKFYEDNKNLSLPEDSYKFGEDKTKNKQDIRRSMSFNFLMEKTEDV